MGEQEESPEVVTGMFQLFSNDVYSTWSFVNTLEYREFDVLPDVLIEPFWVTTL